MEPTRGAVRLILMGTRLRAGVVALGCLLTLAGCGSASSSGSSDSAGKGSISTAHKVGSCAATSSEVKQAVRVASVDVDGDSHVDDVKLTSSSGACPKVLFVKLGSGYVSASLPTDDPSTPAVFGVRLDGRAGNLVVARQDNPRGGYQLHVFAAGPQGLAELKNGDQPLVPFVATDTRPISYTVDCKRGSVVVDQAVATSGGTWDIRRTTYAVKGGTATKTSTKVVGSGLTPKRVDRQMPAGSGVFPSCRA